MSAKPTKKRMYEILVLDTLGSESVVLTSNSWRGRDSISVNLRCWQAA